MDSIRVDKNELLATLKINRGKHRNIFLEAQDGYKTAAIKELEQMLEEAKEGKKIRRSVTLLEPVDQTSDYDRAIRMLEMSKDDIIELSETDFAQYVMDDWRWKHQFLLTNSNYSVSAATTLKSSPSVQEF